MVAEFCPDGLEILGELIKGNNPATFLIIVRTMNYLLRIHFKKEIKSNSNHSLVQLSMLKT